MSFALGRRLIDKNNCKTLEEAIDALNDFHDALGNPVNNPGPGPDGTVPPLYEAPWVPVSDPTAGSVLLMIGGLTTGSVSSGPGTFTIDTIVSFTPGYTHATSPQTVVNTFERALDNNQPVFAVYRPYNDTWETWYDTDTNTGGGGSSYSAGFGLELATTTFSVDDTNYAGSGNEIFGAKAGSVQWDTIQGWLSELSGHTTTSGYSQSIGHLSSGDAQWYPMATLAFGLAQGDVDNTSATFTGDNFTVLSGITPGSTETVQNPLNIGVDDNEDIVVIRSHDSDTWHLLASQPLAVVIGLAQGAVADTDGTFTGDGFTSIWGKAPGSTETITNTFGFAIDDNGKFLAIRAPGTATWYCVQAECPA